MRAPVFGLDVGVVVLGMGVLLLLVEVMVVVLVVLCKIREHGVDNDAVEFRGASPYPNKKHRLHVNRA